MESFVPRFSRSTVLPGTSPSSSARCFGRRTAKLFPHFATLTFIWPAPLDIQCISGRTPCLHPLRPAGNRHHPGARDLDQSERQHQVDETLDLFARASD